MTIAIDFDGTIAQVADFPAIGKPMAGAIEAVAELYKEHYVVIWTCRTGDALLAAVNWMAAFGMQYDGININSPGSIAHYGGDTRKISADVYIDDRNLGGFPGWEKAIATIRQSNTKCNCHARVNPWEGCFPG